MVLWPSGSGTALQKLIHQFKSGQDLVIKTVQTDIRNDIQRKAAEYAAENPFVIIKWPTGSGKTKAVLMAIDKSPPGPKWLVVVPEVLQIENLQADIVKHGFVHLYKDKIEAVICYASMHRYMGKKLRIWLNEAQHLSKLKEDISKTIEYDRIIADSATIPLIVKERLRRLGDFKEYNIDLKEAIEIGLLPEPAVHVLYTELDNTIRRNKWVVGKDTLLVTDKYYSDKLDEQISYWIDRSSEEGDPIWISNRIKQLGSQRKKFLAGCKTEAARFLINQLKGKRLLCYTGSIEQCNELGGKLAVNSKKTKKHNLEILRQFNEYEADKIYVNRMGKEGLNLEGIRAVVIVQLDSGNDEGLSFIQRTGRSLRSDEPEVYLLTVKNTQDEKYLKKALQNIDKKKVKYI